MYVIVFENMYGRVCENMYVIICKTMYVIVCEKMYVENLKVRESSISKMKLLWLFVYHYETSGKYSLIELFSTSGIRVQLVQ